METNKGNTEDAEGTEGTEKGAHAETRRRGVEALPPRPSAEEVDAAIISHSLYGLSSSDVLIAEIKHLRARNDELEAGALIAAEIDRLTRAEALEGGEK